jgi:glycosyltransferase involved in cell wall biosynthesis
MCPTEVYPQVPHAEAVKIMADADALLAIPGDRLPAALSGKLFEYLRARRPIVLVAADGAARALGIDVQVDVLVRPDDVSGLAAALGQLLDAKQSGSLKTSTDPAVVATLEREQGARLLAGLLDAGVAQ